MPAYPSSISDGNFLIAQQNGSWRYSFPFSGVGDMVTFIAERKMRVESDYIKPPIAMTKKQFKLGTAYLVDISDAREVDRTSLLEYDETWASVPVRRTEYGQTTVLRTVAFVNTTPITYTANQTTENVFDYSLTPLPDILAPRNLGSFVVGGDIASFSNTPNIRTVAKNSIGSIYLGKIFQRESFYYVPSIAQVS